MVLYPMYAPIEFWSLGRGGKREGPNVVPHWMSIDQIRIYCAALVRPKKIFEAHGTFKFSYRASGGDHKVCAA